MIDKDLIILIVQIIAALGVVVSVIYLGLQIRQQNIILRANRLSHRGQSSVITQ